MFKKPLPNFTSSAAAAAAATSSSLPDRIIIVRSNATIVVPFNNGGTTATGSATAATLTSTSTSFEARLLGEIQKHPPFDDPAVVNGYPTRLVFARPYSTKNPCHVHFSLAECRFDRTTLVVVVGADSPPLSMKQPPSSPPAARVYLVLGWMLVPPCINHPSLGDRSPRISLLLLRNPTFHMSVDKSFVGDPWAKLVDQIVAGTCEDPIPAPTFQEASLGAIGAAAAAKLRPRENKNGSDDDGGDGGADDRQTSHSKRRRLESELVDVRTTEKAASKKQRLLECWRSLVEEIGDLRQQFLPANFRPGAIVESFALLLMKERPLKSLEPLIWPLVFVLPYYQASEEWVGRLVAARLPEPLAALASQLDSDQVPTPLGMSTTWRSLIVDRVALWLTRTVMPVLCDYLIELCELVEETKSCRDNDSDDNDAATAAAAGNDDDDVNIVDKTGDSKNGAETTIPLNNNSSSSCPSSSSSSSSYSSCFLAETTATTSSSNTNNNDDQDNGDSTRGPADDGSPSDHSSGANAVAVVAARKLLVYRDVIDVLKRFRWDLSTMTLPDNANVHGYQPSRAILQGLNRFARPCSSQLRRLMCYFEGVTQEIPHCYYYYNSSNGNGNYRDGDVEGRHQPALERLTLETAPRCIQQLVAHLIEHRHLHHDQILGFIPSLYNAYRRPQSPPDEALQAAVTWLKENAGIDVATKRYDSQNYLTKIYRILHDAAHPSPSHLQQQQQLLPLGVGVRPPRYQAPESSCETRITGLTRDGKSAACTLCPFSQNGGGQYDIEAAHRACQEDLLSRLKQLRQQERQQQQQQQGEEEQQEERMEESSMSFSQVGLFPSTRWRFVEQRRKGRRIRTEQTGTLVQEPH